MANTLEIEKSASSTQKLDSIFLLSESEDLSKAAVKPSEQVYYSFLRSYTPTYTENLSNDRTNLLTGSQIVFRSNVGERFFAGEIVSGRYLKSYFYSAAEIDRSKDSVKRFDDEHLVSVRTWTYADKLPRIKKISKSVSHIIYQLRRYASFKAGWDGENAQKITWDTITRAISLVVALVHQLDQTGNDLGIPCVGPMADGGIEFELETLFKEFIITIPPSANDEISFLKIDKSGEEEVEEESTASDLEIPSLIIDWFK